MGIFIRAVVTGFGFSLGSALYKKVSSRFGFEESDSDEEADAAGEAEDPEDKSSETTRH
jgi:hypothetical protein